MAATVVRGCCMVLLSMLAVSNTGLRLVAGQLTHNNVATLETIANHITSVVTSLDQVKQEIEQMNTRFRVLSEQVEIMSRQNAAMSRQMSERFDEINTRVGNMSTSNEQLNMKFGGLSERVEDMSRKNGEMSRKVGNISTGVVQMSERIDEINMRVGNMSERIENLPNRQAQSDNFANLRNEITNLTATSQRTISQELLERCSNKSEPRDCNDIKALGWTSSGVYKVYPRTTANSMSVYCDMTTANGGWTVFQRRQDGTEDFYRNWVDYANGFGNPSAEFWLGNNNIHALTSDGRQYTLRVDLGQFNGSTGFAQYNNFTVDSSSNKYALRSLGRYSGTAGDALTDSVGSKFSTRDADEDSSTWHCAQTRKGAWWYDYCSAWSNLNGDYCGAQCSSSTSVFWYRWTGSWKCLKFTEMKIKPNSDQ